jgi:Zn-dependent protease with chaperone function
MLAWIRVACVAVLLVLAGSAAAQADAPARSFFDRRVDRLTNAQLLTEPPAQLVDPIRQRAARTITDVRQGCSFGWALAQIWVLWWLWTSGRAARVRDWLRRHYRSRLYERFGLGVFVALATRAAALIFAFVSYRIGFNVGLTELPMQLWLLNYALGAIEIAFFTGALFTYVLWLVDRTRLWYVVMAATVFAIAFAGAVLQPLATWSRAPYVVAGAAAPVVVEGDASRSRTLAARTEGIGAATRIVLGRELLVAASRPEIAFVIAHESAHVRYDDVAKLVAIGATLVVFAAAVGVFASDRIRFRRDDDVLSRFALVGTMVGLMAMIVFPAYNTYARLLEARADRTARATAPSIAAGVRELVRRADHDMEPLCYRRSTNWYFADDVALGTQIALLRGTSDPCPPYATAPVSPR